MNNFKGKNLLNQRGFTLIELVSIIVISSVLFSLSFFHIRTPSMTLFTAKEELLDAIIFARTYALTHSLGDKELRITLKENVLDIQLNNESLSSLTKNYPIAINSKVIITPQESLYFSEDGETHSKTLFLAIDNTSISVTIEETGYAY